LILGELLRRQGRLDEAIDAYRETIRRHGTTVGAASYRLGMVLREAGRFGEALTTFRTILDRQPGDAMARFQIGETLRRAGRLDEATATFRKMVADLRQNVEKTPDDPSARHQLAAALVLAGAKEDYRRASATVIARFGKSEPTDSNVARACLLIPDAVADPRVPLEFAQSAARPPTFPWTYYVLALACLRAGQPEQAIQHAEESIKLDPTWHATVLNRVVLALAHAKLGHTQEARHWLESTDHPPGMPRRNGQKVEVLGQNAPWWDRADFLILRREADALILDSQFPIDPFR
jgi:tetratricopeptide (TPR) repeat protein